MVQFLRKQLPSLLLFIGIALFITYFSLFSILRYHKLLSHYYDLGIMHQTVYNTYQGLSTGDLSRILEMTDPHESVDQVKRMAVHNDILLGFLAPFYFIYDGPETLLVLQATIVAVGAFFLYKITLIVFKSSKKKDWIALAFSVSYLLYPPLQKAVNFDFHAVTLAPTLLLGVYYFWLKKKYVWSFIFIFFTLMTKEQVGLVVSLFGLYIITNELTHFDLSLFKKPNLLLHLQKKFHKSDKKELIFGVLTLSIGFLWVLISMLWIIPYFRGSEHFGAEYYDYLKQNPLLFFSVVFRYETFHYVSILLAPIGLLSVFSPYHLVISASEFTTNILSSNGNMRNIYFHYDTALTAFVFISAVYGGSNLIKFLSKFDERSDFIKKYIPFSRETALIFYILGSSILYSLYMGPLPWGHHKDIYAWVSNPEKIEDVQLWQAYLQKDLLPVSASGHLAPHFTSRRYFYDFAGGYEKADYVVIDRDDINHGFQNIESMANYEALKKDWKYIRIYENRGIEVYKKFHNLKDIITKI